MIASDFFDLFYNVYVLNRLKPNTVRGYRVNVYNHIIPFFSDYNISDISFADIDDFVAYLRSKGLSNTSIRYALAVIRKAFSFAVKRGYLHTNVLFSYDFPKSSPFFYNLLDGHQLDCLCRYLEDSDIYPAVLLAGFYGMRKGEVLALTMDKLLWVPDLRQFIITVDCSATDVSHQRELSSTKTVSGVRKIVLSRSHSLKLQFYIAYRGISGSDYLCQTSNGFLTGNQLMYHFKRALSALNLPNIRFHDLRHSYATLMLKNGVNPKIVSSVLGHSDVSTTLNIYSHYDYTMQEACLDILDDL